MFYENNSMKRDQNRFYPFFVYYDTFWGVNPGPMAVNCESTWH